MLIKSIIRYSFVPLFVISIIACEKEIRDSESTDKVAEETIEFLVELASKRYMEEEFNEDSDAVSETRGLIDEYTASGEDFSANRAQRNSLVSCLVSVEPDNEQRQLIGRTLDAYSGRNERIIRSYRKDLENLNHRMEYARRELNEKFRTGEIDREELHRRWTALNERYREAVYNIRTKNAEAFSRSYKILLEQLSGILEQEQWRAFTACISS
jgi:hypothetical protein